MIVPAFLWLAICLILCAFAWSSGRWRALVAMPVLCGLVAGAMYVPLGHPRFTAPPKGKYQVLGADIQVDIAIYVLLKREGDRQPVYYVLPYSNQKAGELQNAMDTGGQGGVAANVNGDGGVSYDGAQPVTGENDKRPEQPLATIPPQ